MYNLLVSGAESAWDGKPVFFDADRCVSHNEYTSKTVSEQFGDLSAKSLVALQANPCIFAQETWNKTAPKFGFITTTAHRQGRVRIEYEVLDVPSFLTWEDLSKPPIFELDISKLEMNRTHWAVKNVDLCDELSRRGIFRSQESSFRQNPPDKMPRTSRSMGMRSPTGPTSHSVRPDTTVLYTREFLEKEYR